MAGPFDPVWDQQGAQFLQQQQQYQQYQQAILNQRQALAGQGLSAPQVGLGGRQGIPNPMQMMQGHVYPTAHPNDYIVQGNPPTVTATAMQTYGEWCEQQRLKEVRARERARERIRQVAGEREWTRYETSQTIYVRSTLVPDAVWGVRSPRFCGVIVFFMEPLLRRYRSVCVHPIACSGPTEVYFLQLLLHARFNEAYLRRQGNMSYPAVDWTPWPDLLDFIKDTAAE